MTIQELREMARKLFPDGGVEEDNNDQIVIYTGLIESRKSFNLITLEEREEEISESE